MRRQELQQRQSQLFVEPFLIFIQPKQRLQFEQPQLEFQFQQPEFESRQELQFWIGAHLLVWLVVFPNAQFRVEPDIFLGVGWQRIILYP